MKRFLIKAAIFSLPIIIFVSYVAYDVLVLPVDYYTFRAWEALSVYEKSAVLPGPFYPNMYLDKAELGDLSGLTKHTVIKRVQWYTDQYGYRKQKTPKENVDIVVIGDSAIAGSSLTQEDIFTEKLGKKVGAVAYPFAPSNFNNFLDDPRFENNPPKIVIFESAEKLVLHISEIIPESLREKKKTFSKKVIERFGLSDTVIANLAVYNDRLKKRAFINYLYARLEELPKNLARGEGVKSVNTSETLENTGMGIREEMVFYSLPESYFEDWEEAHIQRVVKTLKAYQDNLSEKGIKFVFMPIPNKENVYWRQVNGGRRVLNLQRLIDAAEREGIPTVNLWATYNNLYERNPEKLLYHTDDSHWNPYGVDVAVDRTVEKLYEID